MRTGSNTPGIAHDACTASDTDGCGSPGAPNTTRRPLSSSTAAMRRRPSQRTPACSTMRPSSASERRPAGTRRSAARRSSAPPRAVEAKASEASGAAAASASSAAAPNAWRSARRALLVLVGRDVASAGASAPRRAPGARPATSDAATIEPADVPT